MSEEDTTVNMKEPIAKAARERSELLMLDDEDLENLKTWAKRDHRDEVDPTIKSIPDSPRAESAIVDRVRKEKEKDDQDETDELDNEVEIIMSEPVPEIDEEEAFKEKVKSVKKDDPDWEHMKRRGNRSLGRDYLLASLPHLPSIPGTQVGRGRKAAKARHLRNNTDVN